MAFFCGFWMKRFARPNGEGKRNKPEYNIKSFMGMLREKMLRKSNFWKKIMKG